MMLHEVMHMSIHQNLRDLRLLAGLSPEQAAERLELTQQALSRYESGQAQADVETLSRFAALYRTDMNSILYGSSRGQKRLRQIRLLAWSLLGVLLVLTLLDSLLIFAANRFFTFPADVQEVPEALLSVRTALLRAYIVVQRLADAVSLTGCIVLGVLFWFSKRLPPLRRRLIYAAFLVPGCLLLCLPFGLFDPVFRVTDYLLLPCLHIFPNFLLLLIVSLLIDRTKL